MSTPNSRKRAAPGVSPILSIPLNVQQLYNANHDVGSNAPMQWPGLAGPSGDVPGFMNNSTAQGGNTFQGQQANRALVVSNSRNAYNGSADQWLGLGNHVQYTPQGTAGDTVEQENIEVLEERAQKVKKEAQAKRKPIAPFVQKLSSFLEEGKNEDLIRWSSDGKSFIVVDEDEFAKKLIPELFKHNNYASFVRQLNMYGFHKCVGLSDNSMRASERKNKSPSEYSNPYFRRGHPNLLWLINKPKPGGKGKKGGKIQEGDADSDDELAHEEITGLQGMTTPNMAGRSLPPAGAEPQPLPKKEMITIRDELQKVREQQKLILSAINRLQRNNDELYNQAMMFQSQHDRHQSSINAILNFLANVFRKTLEDQGSSQTVGDIISSLITNQGQQSQSGSVFDLGDFVQSQSNAGSSMGVGPSSFHPLGVTTPEMGHVTELFDSASPDLHQELKTNPRESMMRIINDHNATNATGMDLPEARALVANAPNNLDNEQRSKLVDFMAGHLTSSSGCGSRSRPRSRSRSGFCGSAIAFAHPEISTNQNDLEQLRRLQSEQDAKIHEIGDLLGPLSPSGYIPGLSHDHESYFDASTIGMDQFVGGDNFLQDDFADGNDFSFGLDETNLPGGLDLSPSPATRDTPSPTGTEEIPRDDVFAQQQRQQQQQRSDHEHKRRRVG
ncbi:Heat shock factor protein [Escovopsis weberi]|uniref:Heat shock factor protein n=1 Tax=Escovopsis weberi TaxID=150374 RepID=A0A0M9VWH4_ESCWE|nr:Heat shock factor protein [Escovopsis weberi]